MTSRVPGRVCGVADPGTHRLTSEHTRTLTSLASEWAPHLRVVSVSNPEPHLERLNVVATTSDAAAARAAVLDLEAEEIDDARVGLVVLGTPSDAAHPEGVDPEGVGRTIAPRIVAGGAIGAVIGAGAGAGIAAAAGAQTSIVVAAAFGGAALLGVPGAIWATFPRLGGSDAYRQSFVGDDVDAMSIVSLHTDDEQEAERALVRLASHPELAVRLLDADGTTVPADDH
jgi:hypothetical protein